ncbi:uncharacterized protein LOC118193582 [Stegodyphus dumicola]|uniref:uncharacterized protein LOC118193582 n=1 Tax=Stegodyphus dumicola TaxID=202533 RepID=UPI0015B17CAF|nr:uncharacterized protein LOC118193582 [Stegodyphus dumicola]
MSMTERFDQMKAYYDKFGFLHNFGCITANERTDLRKCCDVFSDILTDEITGSDVDARNLCAELHNLAGLVPHSIGALKSLPRIYENNLQDSFTNVSVVLCIALTVPVTVASAERSFSELKLIMSDQRTSITQQQLNGLALISTEHKILDSLDYADLIKDFAKMKVRKVFLH